MTWTPRIIDLEQPAKCDTCPAVVTRVVVNFHDDRYMGAEQCLECAGVSDD